MQPDLTEQDTARHDVADAVEQLLCAVLTAYDAAVPLPPSADPTTPLTVDAARAYQEIATRTAAGLRADPSSGQDVVMDLLDALGLFDVRFPAAGLTPEDPRLFCNAAEDELDSEVENVLVALDGLAEACADFLDTVTEQEPPAKRPRTEDADTAAP